MQVVRVSGTMRKAEEEAIRRARVQIRRAQRAIGGEANAAVKAVEGVVDGEGDLAMFDGIEDLGGEGEEESDGRRDANKVKKVETTWPKSVTHA